jgi:hypothetical protein
VPLRVQAAARLWQAPCRSVVGVQPTVEHSDGIFETVGGADRYEGLTAADCSQGSAASPASSAPYRRRHGLALPRVRRVGGPLRVPARDPGKYQNPGPIAPRFEHSTVIAPGR